MRNVFRDDDVLRDTFYRNAAPKADKAEAADKVDKKAKKPDHYRVICISMYNEDLDRLDGMVNDLKQRGHRKMNRSALIRYALDRVALEDLPKSY